MIEVRRAADRFRTVADGRDTRHSLSFGPHYDPANLRFGLLACHNDDLVQPGHGYPDHPHSNLEIVTWVLSGTLHHADSRGHSGDITPGLVQTMSAGSGVVHAETVDHASGPTRFIQAWVLPDEPGTEPGYSSGTIAVAEEWTPVASGAGHDAAARIGASGATFWAATVPVGSVLTVPDRPFAHLFVAEGSADLTPAQGEVVHLGASDGVRLRGRGRC
ncbi:pirin family protein [Nocardioides alcanivorans]|uniref:pirin family protein n=1 Tax=Nocardioides alcanivorans TaxID=2897352 RepID=UPI001F465732|nr:pirin family protein [Nocardioides alcanivorans]